MTTIYTEEHRQTLEAYLSTHVLPSGMGTEESACTVAAINLAISDAPCPVCGGPRSCRRGDPTAGGVDVAISALNPKGTNHG